MLLFPKYYYTIVYCCYQTFHPVQIPEQPFKGGKG